MDIRVKGRQTLSGEILPSGSKNSAVALIASTILFDKEVVLENIPEIIDVEVMTALLKGMGSKLDWNKKEKKLTIDNSNISYKNLKKEDLGNLRGTSLLWGPMLARFGKVDFRDLPGGCTLGIRPLDTHYIAFRDLGVKVVADRGCVSMDAVGAKAREIWLKEMSPTATENVIMLATGLKGTTKIIGAASEPQVRDLCNFLMKAGVKIQGIGSNMLEIEGGASLSAVEYKILSDHYEITTFLALVAATGGEIKIHNALPGLMENILNVFRAFGLKVEYHGDAIYFKRDQKIELTKYNGNKAVHIKAQPWPGLPVDALPLFIPLALAADSGQILFHNWMYESGLFWTSELNKLGANIIMGDPHRVVVTAGNKLTGATLEAPYIIRAVVAMVMCAMIAEGESLIMDADALYRGHPHFAENLKKLGAKIEVLKETQRK